MVIVERDIWLLAAAVLRAHKTAGQALQAVRANIDAAEAEGKDEAVRYWARVAEALFALTRRVPEGGERVN